MSAAQPQSARPASQHAPLRRDPEFVKLLVGQTISQVGTQVTMLALPLTALLVVHSGTADLGVLRFFMTLPALCFGLAFGMWVDRASPWSQMVLADVCAAIAVALVPLLVAVNLASMPVMFVLAFAIGTAGILFDISWSAYVSMAGRRIGRVTEVNARLQGLAALAFTIGPSIGGALIGLVGAPTAMLADTASYVVSAFSLLLLRERGRPRAERSAARPYVQLIEGFRAVFGHEFLRITTLAGSVDNIFITAVQVVFVPYAVHQKGFSAQVLGLILSIGAVGGVLGATLGPSAIQRFASGRVSVLATGVQALALAAIPLVPGSGILSITLLSTAFFVFCGAIMMDNVVCVTLRQVVTPSQLLARSAGTMRTINQGCIGIGALLGGWLAGTAGTRWALWSAAAGVFMLFVVVASTRLKTLGKLDEVAAATAAS